MKWLTSRQSQRDDHVLSVCEVGSSRGSSLTLGKKMAVEQVVLLVDRAYGAKITDLSTSAALWLVDSPENRPFISALKTKFTPEARGDLTWFSEVPGLSPSELATHMVDTIENHHGEYSQQPPFVRLTIIGTMPSAGLLKIGEELGFRQTLSDPALLEFER